jgi:MoaD family protein
VRVRVRYYAVARDSAGKRDEAVTLPKGATVLDLVHMLMELHGPGFKKIVYDEKDQLLDYLTFSVNDVDIVGLEGFKTILRDGDTVRVMPPIGGG